MNAPVQAATLAPTKMPDRIDPAVWRIMSVAVIGAFMAQIDATVVNVSLASLAGQLHCSLATIHWVTSGYLLALALMLPLSGWLVDRVGTRALYIGCFIGFTAASVLCGLAWSAPSLIFFRALQGMAGGLLAPMAQLTMARAAGRHMAQMISIVAMPVLLAPLLGPVVAGAILQFASWRWLFLINLPVGIAALVLAYLFLPRDGGEASPRALDLAGLALLAPGLMLFLFGVDHIGDAAGRLAVASALLLFGAFVRLAARKGDAALIDLRLLRGNFAASITTMFVMNGIAFSGQMLIPIFLVRAGGLSPSQTGWLMAPLGLGMMCTYPFMGRLTNRFGIRPLAASGACLAFLATLPFIFLAWHGLQPAVLACALFVRGVGLSAIGIPAITSGYRAVARQDLPMATTAMNIVQRIGGPTLTTAVATFLAWRLHAPGAAHAALTPYTAAFCLLCALHAVLLVSVLRLPRALEG